MKVGGGQEVLSRRLRAAGPRVRAPADGLALKDECLEEEAEAPCESGPVAPRLEEEAKGRVDAGARPPHLEEEAEGTCDVGAVELRLVEGLVEARFEVVGLEEEDLTVVEL